MERWEKDWESYLVLHIDFSLTKYMELTDLTGQLNLFLHRWEKIYGKDEAEKTASERLQGIILRASEQIGKQVVVLIDEYDAPLLDSNSDTALQQQLRNEMRKFFSPPQEVGAVSVPTSILRSACSTLSMQRSTRTSGSLRALLPF